MLLLNERKHMDDDKSKLQLHNNVFALDYNCKIKQLLMHFPRVLNILMLWTQLENPCVFLSDCYP